MLILAKQTQWIEIGLGNVLRNRGWHVCFLILACNAFLFVHWLPKIALNTFKQLSLRLRDSRDSADSRDTSQSKMSKAGERKFFLIFSVIYFMYTILLFLFLFLFIFFIFIAFVERKPNFDLWLSEVGCPVQVIG